MAVMEVVSRNDAMARGLGKFYTGRPCRGGHVAQRYTASGNCVMCNSAARADKNKKARIVRRASHTICIQVWVHPDDEVAARAIITDGLRPIFEYRAAVTPGGYHPPALVAVTKQQEAAQRAPIPVDVIPPLPGDSGYVEPQDRTPENWPYGGTHQPRDVMEIEAIAAPLREQQQRLESAAARELEAAAQATAQMDGRNG